MSPVMYSESAMPIHSSQAFEQAGMAFLRPAAPKQNLVRISGCLTQRAGDIPGIDTRQWEYQTKARQGRIGPGV